MVQKISVSLREQAFYINRFSGYHPSMSTHHLHQDYIHVNEQYISRLFKKYTGCSFIEYLNAIRIDEVERYLIHTTLKVNQIAGKVGYSNHVHFWRVFKRNTGISPNQFRILKQNDNL